MMGPSQHPDFCQKICCQSVSRFCHVSVRRWFFSFFCGFLATRRAGDGQGVSEEKYIHVRVGEEEEEN